MPRKPSSTAERVITHRELNRALLARQLLLERSPLAVLPAIDQIGGQHAQIPSAPYIGLWSRLATFDRDDLAREIDNRSVVKATLMRGTLHFMTRTDFLHLRGSMKSVLHHFSDWLIQDRGVSIPIEEILDVGRNFLSEPRTFAEISKMFTERYPDVDVAALRQAVRMRLPLVQTPVDNKRWSFPGSPRWVMAEDWLGTPIPDHDNLRDLFWRYLAAFGPATIADFQTWSGLTSMKDRIEPFKANLVIYADEKGRELLDLPDAPIPAADTPAPIRLIGDLDNVIFGHAERDRVLANEHRMTVLKINATGNKTVLVDGFVRAMWDVEVRKKIATLTIQPLEKITKANQKQIIAEAERILPFMEPDAKGYEIQFTDL